MDETVQKIEDKVKAAELFIASNAFSDAINLFFDIIDFYNENENIEQRDQVLLKVRDCYIRIAEEAQKQHEYFDAAEAYSSAGSLLNQHDKNKIAHPLFTAAIECLRCAAKQAFDQKDYTEASRLFSNAAQFAKNELHDLDSAAKYDREAIAILEKEIELNLESDDLSTLCQSRLELGKVYEHLADFPHAIAEYQKVVDCAKKNGLEHELMAECFQHMASCHDLLGNNHEMVQCLNKAVEYRLKEAENLSKCDLPLEAVQNFIFAANCVEKLQRQDDLLKSIIKSEADCFLTVAKSNILQGKLLQAAFYERNAAYCFNQLGQSDTSIDLLLAAAEKLLSINEYYGAANNFQDASLYQEHVGNYLKAADYAVKAAELAQKSGDLELTVENYLRAAQIYHYIGYPEKAHSSYSSLANCYVKLAETSLQSDNYHVAAFLFYKAGSFFSKINVPTTAATCYERAIKYYEKAINIAIKENEDLLASYSACCATIVCLIMKQPARAEIILNDIRANPSSDYYTFSNSLITVFKTKNSAEYDTLNQKFSKIIKNSPEIQNMFENSQIEP